ncbi:MAG: hypothetical protein AABW90_02680 [Nanoarchaeota archaeon]
MVERKKRIRKKAEKIGITDEKSHIVESIDSKKVEIEKTNDINKIIDIDKENIIEKPGEIEKTDSDYINVKNIKESKEIGVNKKIIEDNDKERLIRETKSNDLSDTKTENINNETAGEQNDKDLEEIQNKQIKMAVFFMIGVILILVLVFFIKGNFIDKFNYKGLVFQKTQLGDIMFYSTRFPVVEVTGQVIGDYAINLRNDPRKLAFISINTTNEKIEFAIDKGKYDPVYISLNPFMKNCEDSGLALLELSGFLKDSGLEVRSSVTDKAYAEANNLIQRWCYNSAFDTVIIITSGNITTINEIAPNCYEIVFKECEILQASERFMLVVLEDYASRFKR